jgi:predicted transcriptional regulator
MAATKKRSRRSAALRRENYGQRMFGDVLSMASTVAESRKHQAAERLSELASATRNFTNTVEDLPYLRDYTDAAANRIDELAEYVDRTDVPEMLDDIASFARRQPMATLALGLAAGLVTTQLMRGRVMRASRSGSPGRASSRRRRKAR